MSAQLGRRSRAATRLKALAGQVEMVMLQRSTAEPWWLAAELRSSLEYALDLLHDLAVERGLESVDATTALAVRDEVAIHLRASADIEAADAQPQRYLKLLVRAADRLVTAYR